MILCMCGPSTKLFDTGQVIFCHFTGIVLLCHFVLIRVYFTNQLMLMFFEVGRMDWDKRISKLNSFRMIFFNVFTVCQR